MRKNAGEDELPKKLLSYDIVDELVINYHAEYVTIAWLKCYEILEYYKLLDSVKTNTIHYFGICEQPGAFVFATNHYVKQKLNKSFEFTLQSLNSNIIKGSFRPEKNLYEKYKNNYDYGADMTGDVTNIENIKYYRKKFYNNHFDIITADCGQDCSDDFSQQEKNLMEVVMGQFLLSISLCSKNTNYFFKLFTIYEHQMKEIIYLLSTLFEKVTICRTIATKMASGEIYCVCINFKYNKQDINPILQQLYDIYGKYLTDKTTSITKNDTITTNDNDFINNINKINKILSYRRLTNLNFLYFRINNINFTRNNNYVKDKINEIVKHYVQYYMSLYNIKSLDNQNKLVPTKFKSKYVQSRQLVNTTSKYYYLFVYKTDPIFNNGLYIYYLIGKNYKTDYKIIKSKITPTYYKEKPYDNVNMSLNITLRKIKRVVTFTTISQINLYGYYNYIKCVDKVISFIKKYNKSIKYVNVYNISTVEKDPRLLKHTDDKLISVLEKNNNIKYNYHSKNNFDINVEYKQNTIYIISCIERLNTILNGKIISNTIIELLLNMIQNIDDKSSIILFLNYDVIILFDIINLFGKYFEHVNVFKYKYYMGNTLYIIFDKKKKNISNNKVEYIKYICNKGNIKRLFSIDTTISIKDFLTDIVDDYTNRMFVVYNMTELKLRNDPRYDLVYDFIKPYKETFYNNYLKRYNNVLK